MQLLWIALSTLASEDLACVAAGVLIAEGKIGWAGGIFACFAGIAAGDLLLFLAGRLVGRGAMRWRLLRRTLPETAVDRASAWLQERGMAVVFLSRFTPGLRLPTYFAAGVLKTSVLSFTGYFLCAAAVWTPLLVGATAFLGQRVVPGVWTAAGGLAILLSLRLGTNRRFVGFCKRKFRWEFWPAWAAYLPLIPYLLWLAVKHRSLTLFTAANPGIPTGGFVGESKSAILRHLSSVPGLVPRFVVLRPGTLLPDVAFPVVLKPDTGERGTGVAIIRSQEQLNDYLSHAASDTIVQEYVPGLEFGIFYIRRPLQAVGFVSSITRKCFPELAGDGRSTLRQLILNDRRAVCLAKAYFAAARRPLHSIPAAGETVPLVEIGSHCRGSVFLDAGHLLTSALEKAVDRAAKAHPGFYFGRFDVRTPSIEALQAGEFRVLELNGVTAEATHVYDPAVSLWSAYRTMFRQWRLAFEIGAQNRDLGAEPMSLGAFVGLIGQERRRLTATPRSA